MSRRAFTIGLCCVSIVASIASAAHVDEDRRGQRPDPPASMSELRERFLATYTPLSDTSRVDLESGEFYTFSQTPEVGVCYAIAALGPGDTDIDIRVRRGGEIVAQDVQNDHFPIATWCAAIASPVRVELKAFSGGGDIEYGVFFEPNTRAQASGDLDELSNRLASAFARSAPRWTPVGSQWRSTFPRPGIQTLSFDASADRCYAVAAIGQAGVVDIDLLLLDDEGQERSRDFALDAAPMVAYCADRAQPIEVRVAVTTGRGVVAAQVLEHAP